ncbi:unnamed protein product [Discosporangium mesarthrocarpum]
MLATMSEAVEAARQCIGGWSGGAGNREGLGAALDRGQDGCGMSALEMARVMGELLRRSQSEYELQESIVNAVTYDTPQQVLTTYSATLALRPFMDAKFLRQTREVHALSTGLETQSIPKGYRRKKTRGQTTWNSGDS